VSRPESCVDNNDHKSNEDSRACAVLCFRGGFQPGQRAVRSRGYDRSTRDLLIGRTAEPLNMGRALRCALATALLHIAGRQAHRAPRQTRCSSGGLGKSAAVRNETQRSLVVNMRILHWNDNPDSLTRDLFSLESEPISNPKIFPAPESELPSTPSSARAKSRW